MKNEHLKGKRGNGIVEFLKKYTYPGNNVIYEPGDLEHFDISTAKILASKKIVKLLNL